MHDVIFNMTTLIWMWSLWSFQEILNVLCCWSFESRPMSTKSYTYTYKPKGGIWAICAQLDLKVIYKGFKKERRLTNFYKFWGKEVHCIGNFSKNVRMLQSCRSHGMEGYIGNFSNIHTLIFWENDFANYIKKFIVITKNKINFRG